MENTIFVICDVNVMGLAKKIAPGKPIFTITADEEHKNMETVLEICRWLMNKGADRQSVLYAVGGGVTLDIVGFVASIYKRGISYINYPTTIVSQIDAGIGGKIGINLDGFKNIVSLVKFPDDTLLISEALKTLPPKELKSGAAEMLKIFIIADKGLYERAVSLFSASRLNYASLNSLILAAADIKLKIVEKDPYENDLRRVFNLGYTFGHAIEWYQSGQKFSHGEAVAIGIIKAAEISENLGFAKYGLSDKLRKDFLACGLPVTLPYPETELMPAIRQNKKLENDLIPFTIIRKIGKVTVEGLYEEELI